MEYNGNSLIPLIAPKSRANGVRLLTIKADGASVAMKTIVVK